MRIVLPEVGDILAYPVKPKCIETRCRVARLAKKLRISYKEVVNEKTSDQHFLGRSHGRGRGRTGRHPTIGFSIFGAADRYSGSAFCPANRTGARCSGAKASNRNEFRSGWRSKPNRS